jgi:hypothetical protein
MVVDAVQGEPVSTPISRQERESNGNFTILPLLTGSFVRFQSAESGRLQLFPV